MVPISQKQKDGNPFHQEEEGQLAVDVLETESEIVVKSTIAGVRPENLEIQLTSDLLTIRGKRLGEEAPGARYYAHECYWGNFSRSIILPHHVHADRAKATLTHGLLVINLPKSAGEIPVPLTVNR